MDRAAEQVQRWDDKAERRAGASVTISARRQDKLDSLIADWGAGNAIAADATDPGAVRAMVAAAAEQMGGLDLVVYVAGFGFLQPLAETDPDGWVDVFRVNVVGANLVAGAALDHLDPDGAVAFISSRTVEDNNAFFAPYSATKAALDQCIRAWRAEHPDRRFIRVVMGNAQPTEFANHMGDMEILGRALPRWIEQGINVGHMMETTDVGRALADAFAVALDHPAVDSSELKFDARIPPTEHGDLMSDDTTDRWERGAAKINEVYAGNVFPIPKGTMPFYDVMLETIFGTVWDRPELSIRDRRLLVMGAIAAFGSTETWKVQARSALDRGELTPEQLRECLIQLAPYAGYPNVADFTAPTEEIIAAFEAASEGDAT